eukprot:473483-Rhodomonas_salina.1
MASSSRSGLSRLALISGIEMLTLDSHSAFFSGHLSMSSLPLRSPIATRPVLGRKSVGMAASTALWSCRLWMESSLRGANTTKLWSRSASATQARDRCSRGAINPHPSWSADARLNLRALNPS